MMKIEVEARKHAREFSSKGRTAEHVAFAELVSTVTHLEECTTLIYTAKADHAKAATKADIEYNLWAALVELEGEDIADTICEVVFPEAALAAAA